MANKDRVNFTDFLEIVEQRASEVMHERPGLDWEIMDLIDEFKRKFGDTEIVSVSDLFELCRRIDEQMDIPPAIKNIIHEARFRIQEDVIDEFYKPERDRNYRNRAGISEVGRKENLAKLVGKLIPVIRMNKPEKINPRWIQMHATDALPQFKALIYDKKTKIWDWDQVKDLLPADIAKIFDAKTKQTLTERDKRACEAYGKLAKNIDPRVVTEVLIKMGLVEKTDFKRFVKVLCDYLDECEMPEPDLDNVPDIPPAFLQFPEIKRLLFVRMRDKIYRQLTEDEEKNPSVKQKHKFSKTRAKVEKLLSKMTDDKYEEHRELYNEVLAYYEEVLAIEAPEGMSTSIIDKNGKSWEFPSLRQKIAMHEMKVHRRKLIEFFMGKGKTASAFLAKEHVGARKMIYICPPGKLVNEVEQRVNKYYTKGNRPTVGKLESGDKAMTLAEFNEATSKDIVILPYSMLSSEVEGERLVDRLKGVEFDFMTVDEAHFAKNIEGRNTQAVFELATEIPGLYDEGHIALLSADSTPNTPNDIIPQLRIYDKDMYGDLKSLNRLLKSEDPLKARISLSEFVLTLDKPENWKKYVEYVDFDLYEDERKIYNAIQNRDDLSHTQKLNLLYLCCINPNLFTPNNVESHLFDKTTEIIDEEQKTYDTVFVVENKLKEGIGRTGNKYPQETFVAKLKEKYGSDAEVHIIDGDTSPTERERILDLTELNDGVKRIVYVYGDIIRHGIDLSHIHRCIFLNPTFNTADTVQLVKRFAREGNEDAKVFILTAIDTVMEGIRIHADRKYQLNERFKEGGILTDEDFDFLNLDDLANKIQFDEAVISLGTAITEQIEPTREKLNRLIGYLHNKGAKFYEKHMNQLGQLFAELFIENWEITYSGNNGRFVSGLIKQLEFDGIVKARRIADICCGPLVLQNTLGVENDGKKRDIHSFDINSAMLEAGTKMLKNRDPDAKSKADQGSMDDLSCYSDGQFDVTNCSLGIYYTKLNTQFKNPSRDERVKAIAEMNRITKTGGVVILTLPPSVGTDVQRPKFIQAMRDHFGLEAIEDYTGEGRSTDGEHSFENQTMVFKKIGEPSLGGLNLKDLKLSRFKKKVKGEGGTPKEMFKESKGFVHKMFEIGKKFLKFDSETEHQKELRELKELRVAEATTFLEGIKGQHGSLFGLPQKVKDEITAKKIFIIDVGAEVAEFHFSDDPNPVPDTYPID